MQNCFKVGVYQGSSSRGKIEQKTGKNRGKIEQKTGKNYLIAMG
jgi:hypothetical protein